jgi:hypothetical protein
MNRRDGMRATSISFAFLVLIGFTGYTSPGGDASDDPGRGDAGGSGGSNGVVVRSLSRLPEAVPT